VTTVTYQRVGGIGCIAIDNPPVNALGRPVRSGLVAALASALTDPDARAVVLHGAGDMFSAGADIREFGTPEAAADPDLSAVIAAFEGSPKPVVAVLHGTALGGALALALGCHYRVGMPATRMGLPEVKLGILPGAGGTQRLTRVTGVRAALDIITTGDVLSAERARELGILDAVISAGTPHEAGTQFARQVVDRNMPPVRVRDRTDRVADARAEMSVFDEYRARSRKQGRGQTSPLACIDAIEAAVTLPFDYGLKRERELCAACHATDEHRALVHAFFSTREAGKIPGLAKDRPPARVERAAVIGCGTMGGGIAMCFADAGIPVTVVEKTQDALDGGLQRVRDNYARSVARGRLAAEAAAQRMGLIAPSLEIADIASADLVIEAVFEDMATNKDIFRRLDALAKPGAVLATNTSYLDVNEIAAVTRRPSEVLGTHFFSPANVMKLLEVVRTGSASDRTLETVLAAGAAIGKVCVVAGVCDGFIGNRMYRAYQRQCFYMLEDGALPYEVDAAITAFGFAMGPLAVGDLTGHDVDFLNRRREDAFRDPAERYVELPDKLVQMGRLGQKTGAGFYRYGSDRRKPIRDPEIEALVVEESLRKGIARRPIAPEAIRLRALAALANEGARILAERIAIRSGDIDVTWINGYGFPVHQGGPMFWADAYGLDRLLSEIERFGRDDPRTWQPAPLLVELAASRRTFGRWSAENLTSCVRGRSART
jgi:3-hydroxyacyl-CoA dehydrogenase